MDDDMESDIECSTCFSLQEAIDQLEKICYYIDLTCQNVKKKEDFGLQKGYLKEQIKAIGKAQNWHQYYHATGKSLSSGNSNVDFTSGTVKRRWRPS